jgi:hypothetical protein
MIILVFFLWFCAHDILGWNEPGAFGGCFTLVFLLRLRFYEYMNCYNISFTLELVTAVIAN